MHPDAGVRLIPVMRHVGGAAVGMREGAVVLVIIGLVTLAAPLNLAAQKRVDYCGTPSCEQSGRGYAMCERLHSALDSIPATTALPVCNLSLLQHGFDTAEWRSVPVSEHLRIAYDIEMYLVLPNAGDHYYSTWPEYFPDSYWATGKNFNYPITWRRVPYETWLSDYQARIQSGQIEPRLSFASVQLNERGIQRLIRYERIPGGRKAECERGVHDAGNGDSGAYIFSAGASDESPVYPILGVSDLPFEVLIYQGRGVFFSVTGPGYYAMDVLVASPPNLLNPIVGYAAGQRCGFRGAENR